MDLSLTILNDNVDKEDGVWVIVRLTDSKACFCKLEFVTETNEIPNVTCFKASGYEAI